MIAAAAMLQACVFVPRTTQVYDFECRVMARQMVLEGTQVAAIQSCANQGCVALVVAASAVTAATVVISGTIVVVGNVAYWLEKKARCNAAPAEETKLRESLGQGQGSSGRQSARISDAPSPAAADA